MMRQYLHAGFGAALMTATALAGSASAAPRDNDAAMAAPSATTRADADETSRSMSNNNGAMSTDRDTGLDRARDRMSQQGLEHSRAQARNFGRDGNDREGVRDKDATHTDRDGDRNTSGDR